MCPDTLESDPLFLHFHDLINAALSVHDSGLYAVDGLICRFEAFPVVDRPGIAKLVIFEGTLATARLDGAHQLLIVVNHGIGKDLCMMEMGVAPSEHVLYQRVEVGKSECERQVDDTVDSEPGELETKLDVVGCLAGRRVQF